MGHVCVFRHALALDECRVKFQPEYANGGLGPRTGDDSVGDVKEVCGGGSTLNEDLKNFGPALRWMTYEAIRYGLRIEPYEGAWKPPQLTESLKGFWNFLELLPFPSLSYRDENSITWSPHSWAGRTIQPGQLIHQSVLSQEVVRVHTTAGLIPGDFPIIGDIQYEANASYRPRAILGSSFDGTTWEDILSSSEMGPLIEQDPFENASHALAALARACLSIELSESDGFNVFDVSLLTLQSFLHDETRLASLIEVPDAGGTLLTALGVAVHYPDAAATRDLKETLIRLLSKSRPIPTTARLPSVAQVYQWGHLIQPAYREDFAHILQPYVSLQYWKPPYADWNPQKLFGSTMVLAWDGSSERPEMLIRIRGKGMAISADGKLSAVANGNIIKVIDTTTEPPLVSHGTDETATNWITGIASLCFSEDHQIIATGHEEGWVKLWRREGERWQVYKEMYHWKATIFGLTFSKDGSKLAVEPYLANAQVWNLADDDSFVELEGSAESSSLAWSPSGDHVFYGLADGSLHAWNIGQEKPKLVHNFKAHDSDIWGLALRRDGQVLVTGSSDKKIRAWRSGTFDKILEFEMDERVHSVNFSADGKQLVSAGTEGTLHIWDLDLGG
ncbi:hypothetical protein ONZ45_g11496 [Pleurotus djamor]|nr:hypothetical protein ONZ45_g11496 [Pleurotus djamor]